MLPKADGTTVLQLSAKDVVLGRPDMILLPHPPPKCPEIQMFRGIEDPLGVLGRV